jgi:hypothetical protein
MAALNYSQGVPEQVPSLDAGTPHQSGRGADAEAFGGGLAQGGEALGQGMLTSAKFFGKVVADNGSNDLQDFTSKKMHGDPSKNTIGPDGQPVYDTGYMGLKGRAALDRRPELEREINDKIKEIRSTLQTPEQQLEFDNFSRRYRTGAVEKIGSHADAQATSWYTSVNTATAKLAADHIANNFDSETDYLHGREDLRASYIKNAQLAGGSPETVAIAKREADQVALTARLNAMAVKNPARAMDMLDKNKDVAGVKYDDLANHYRTRAEAQRGDEAAEAALRKTYQTTPPAPPGAFRNVVLDQAGAPYGISGAYLARTQQIESGSNPNQTSSTGAMGPFQFVGSTARQYGLKDPFNYAASADAAARLAADNKASLTQSLGRPPTDAELYIAHQQGAGGAAKLLANPTARAGDLVGDKAIRVNGGDPDAPAAAFTSMWASKFNGAPGAAQSASRKAEAYQIIQSDPNLSDVARQHATIRINQQITAQQIAEEQDTKARKAISDKAMDEYVTQMLNGTSGPGIVNQIANDPRLDAHVKWSLGQAAQAKIGDDIASSTQAYGAGFWKAYQQVTAPRNDPARISDISQLLSQAGPNADPNHQLTLAGIAKLRETMAMAEKDVDTSSVVQAKTHLMKYAQSKLSFDQEMLYPGLPPMKDEKGVQAFNATFIPKFEAAYSAWIKAGKNPWEFLTQKNVDELMKGIRDPNEMKAARIAAGGAGNIADLPAGPVPAAPAGVEDKAWQRIMSAPPKRPDGNPWSPEMWAKAIAILRADPSESTKAAFDKRFAPSGYTAKDILSRLPPPAPAEPVAVLGIRG